MTANTVLESKTEDCRLEESRTAPFHLPPSEAEPETLRLILGVGRSGTTWVSRVLSKTRRRVRFFMEPLFHLEPRLPFHDTGDHTAVGYESFSPDHPLLSAYRRIASRHLGGSQVKGLERDDDAWELCLVKEVHALLGTEGLLRAWQTPALFVLRDPVNVADSLFAAQTLQTIYLNHEVEAVQQEAFLDRFAPGRQETVRQLFAGAARREPREQIILAKVICTQVLQEMFLALAEEFPFVKTLCYEKLCEAPRETLKAASQALSIPWDQDIEEYLSKTMQADATSNDPYSIMRNTAEQRMRPLKFLNPEETALCRAALGAMRG